MPILASEITIHSLNWIFHEKSKTLTQIFWILILISSFCGFGFYFYAAIMKWHYTPDIVIDSRLRLPQDFPFPAFTVCRPFFAVNNLANFSRISNKLVQISNFTLTQTECEYFIANNNWCDLRGNLILLHENLKNACNNYLKEIEEMNILEKIDESSLLLVELRKRKIFTDYGMCLTINMQVIKI